MTGVRDGTLRFSLADDDDREEIYRIRHEIYATELGQHEENPHGRLTDALDEHNVYVIARMHDDVAGFVSITPPSAPSYSLDKYVPRDEWPFVCDDRTYEVRLLTVREPYRGLPLAFLLLYSAYRWIEDRGGHVIFGIGRAEIKQIYAKLGAAPSGLEMRSGAVSYELMWATAEEYRQRLGRRNRFVRKLAERVDWQLDVPFLRISPCFHGGAFFDAVGVRFDDLDRRRGVVNADVLDAWFPPSPKVVEAICGELEWLARTSPPTHCDGMVEAIAEARDVARDAILPGAGSSALIYRVFREWLTPDSRVLILDPMYGEYEHVLSHVVGCRVYRFELSPEAGPLDVEALLDRLAAPPGFDLVVIVNPNSPTGRHVPRRDMIELLERVPLPTRVWIDETYVEYAGRDQTLEAYAAATDRVVVCKSLSKVYALSGMRVAYLCGPSSLLAPIRVISPPWAVSLPGQLAAVRALDDPDYYHERYVQTHAYRAVLADELAALPDVQVVPSTTNFLLLQLGNGGPTAATVVDRCRSHGVYVRDASTMGRSLNAHSLRTAVKTQEDNERIVAALGASIGGTNDGMDDSP
jgi:histidinol-phosphate/aromatic aminotransferase/cobyric acid decarboxylase-like protein/GNAT superfamily N-acetyltransferase